MLVQEQTTFHNSKLQVIRIEQYENERQAPGAVGHTMGTDHTRESNAWRYFTEKSQGKTALQLIKLIAVLYTWSFTTSNSARRAAGGHGAFVRKVTFKTLLCTTRYRHYNAFLRFHRKFWLLVMSLKTQFYVQMCRNNISVIQDFKLDKLSRW